MASPSVFPKVDVFRNDGREALIAALKSIRGKKDLIIDPDLMKPLDRIAGASLLKQNDVEKLYKFEPAQNFATSGNHHVYLVRPKISTIDEICNQIREERSKGIARLYFIIMVPRKLHICDIILEQQGVYGYVRTLACNLDIIPLDRDILSLQLPEFFRSFYLDGDQTWLHTVAFSIVNIQASFGQIPNTYCIGRGSKLVHDLYKTIIESFGKPSETEYQIGHLFIVDRDVDFVSPLCSQLTYEGLLDDEFGIETGYIEFGKDVTGKDQNVKLLLTSQDDVYELTRSRHFSNVFTFLSAKAKELQTGYEKRKNISTVSDMKDFVANELKNLDQTKKYLGYHIGACEAIMERKNKVDFEEYMKTEHSMLEGVETRENISYIEDCINRQFHSSLTLKLLCLLSLTLDGIPSREYKSLKQQYLQSHGYEYMLTFFNLKKLGILTDQESPVAQQGKSSGFGKVAAGVASLAKRSSYQSFCKKLNLVPKSPESVNLKSPDDMSYVFSGAFTPIICSLVEKVLSKDGLSALDDLAKIIPGGVHTDIKGKSAKGKGGHTSNPHESTASRTVLVYFLGGCTYSEIAALRLLGRKTGYRFLIATTDIVNGMRLLGSIIEKRTS